MPPARLVARYVRARKLVEVGAGQRFDDAGAFARALPACRVVVTDTDMRVLRAEAPLWAEVDDITRPRWDLYAGASLLYGIRLPEDLHAPAAAVARKVGADFALRLLGDEAPALPGWDAGEAVGSGWHLWAAKGAGQRAG
jgi:uncharacterized protein